MSATDRTTDGQGQHLIPRRHAGRNRPARRRSGTRRRTRRSPGTPGTAAASARPSRAPRSRSSFARRTLPESSSPPPVVVIEPPATAPAKAAAQAAPAPSPQLAHQPGSPPAQPAAQPGAQAPARAQLQVQASATCPSCTAPLEAGTMFCRYCGTPVRPARADALPASPRAQQPGGAPRPRKNAKADAGKPPKVWVTIGLVIIGYGIGWLVSWIPGMSSDDYFSIGGALGGLVFGVALWKAGILRHWAYAILPGFFWSLSSAIGYFEGWVLGGIVLGVVFGIVTGVQLLIRIGKRS